MSLSGICIGHDDAAQGTVRILLVLKSHPRLGRSHIEISKHEALFHLPADQEERFTHTLRNRGLVSVLTSAYEEDTHAHCAGESRSSRNSDPSPSEAVASNRTSETGTRQCRTPSYGTESERCESVGPSTSFIELTEDL